MTFIPPQNPQPVSGTVDVGNLPEVQSIDDNGGSVTIDGSVGVTSLPVGQQTMAQSTPVVLSSDHDVLPMGHYLPGNTTSTPINAGLDYTGSWENIEVHPSVVIACKTDKDGTLYAQFSSDGVNIHSSIPFKVVANTNEVHRLSSTRRFFRVYFVNSSASNQTTFDLQCMTGFQGQLTSALNSVIQSDADAALVRPLDFNLMVAEGLYESRSNTIKEGLNQSISNGSGLVCDLVAPLNGNNAYTGFPLSPIAGEINVAGADTGTVYYAYMATDTDLDYTFGSKAVTGAGTYALGHNIWRCNFAYFVKDSSTLLNVGDITIRSVGAANTFCVIPAGFSQSYCAAYTVPYNSSIYLDTRRGSMRGSTSGSLDGYFWYRPYGESPRLRFPFELQYGTLYFDDDDYLTKVPARVDICPRVTVSSANNLSAKLSYRFVKVKE